MGSAAALIGGIVRREARQFVLLFDPALGVTLEQAQRRAAIPKSNTLLQLPGLLIFDAVPAEEHVGTSSITAHPVEQGADISDHSRPLPRSVTLTGMVSNRPIVPLFVQGLFTTRAEDARAQLDTWRQQGTALTLATSIEVYENMLIQSISTPRNAQLGKAVRMGINLQEVFTASTETVTAPRTVSTRAQTKKKVAVKAKKELSTDTGPGKSAAATVVDAIGSFINR